MELKLIKTWGVAIVLFLAVFAGCLAAIFQPVRIVTESYGTTSKVVSLVDTSNTWVENPNHFIPVGITAGIAIIGAFWCFYMMSKAGKEE